MEARRIPFFFLLLRPLSAKCVLLFKDQNVSFETRKNCFGMLIDNYCSKRRDEELNDKYRTIGVQNADFEFLVCMRQFQECLLKITFRLCE